MGPNALLCLTGSELTRGETEDSNGPFLATELSELGVRVDEMVLVPDEPKLLAAAVRGAIQRADIVLLSGGLGPTADDHTVKVLAEVLDQKIRRNPEAEARMRARALARGFSEEKIPPNYFKQAEVIEGAEVLLNPVGLAPGMIITTARGLLAVMPGVPREMQAMFRKLVLPAIQKRFQIEPPRIVRAKIIGLGESWAEARIQRLGIDFGRIEYGISAKPGELLVKFISHAPPSHAYLDEVRSLLEKEFGEDLLLLPEGLKDSSGAAMEVEHSLLVHNLLLASAKTVAAAESCTGGLVAKSLTDHPGSSAYFLGSVIAYDNRAKERILSIPASLIEKHGAVSEEVCGAMARAARDLFGADFGIGTTGIAGPTGGTPEKPVGLVYIGLASSKSLSGRGEGDLLVERHVFWGNRENVRTLATVRGLDLIRRNLGRA
jgi:nicotinamide-nucleotide amidase